MQEPTQLSEEKAEPSFYRLHTFDAKGPDRRETKAYLASRAKFIPSENGKGATPITYDVTLNVFSFTNKKRDQANELRASRAVKRAEEKVKRSQRNANKTVIA